MSQRKGRIAVVGVAIAAAVVAVAGGAQAAGNAGIADNTVDSNDLKNGGINQVDLSSGLYNILRTPNENTVTGWSIKDGSIQYSDLAPGTQAALKGAKGDKGDTGTKGDKGDKGETGPKGDKGDPATYQGAHWGTIHRNVIGAADAELGATSTQPPSGVGALNLHTASDKDKVAFGNEVDFKTLKVADITKVGFSVYTTGENNNSPGDNMPSIIFEIDPQLKALPTTRYTSLVYTPAETTSNAWTAVNAATDATPHWGFTGTAFNGTECSINGARCTWSQIQAYLDDGGEDATVAYSLGISKGRDYAFSGAVDDLVVNNDKYDFEPLGVKKTTS